VKKGVTEVVFDRGGYLYHGASRRLRMQRVKRLEFLGFWN